jgi:ribosomal protein S27AE
MSNSDWWANKLGSKGTGVSTPATGPLPGNVYKATTNQPTVRVDYDPEQDQLVSKAVSSRSSATCPNCMSGNYFAPQGTERMRCYDCGYPVIQSATGSGLPSSSSGPATPSKQVGTSGFNPTTIVDRIG